MRPRQDFLIRRCRTDLDSGVLTAKNVAWGEFGHFAAYTARLNWFVPSGLISTVARIAAIAVLSVLAFSSGYSGERWRYRAEYC